ncbi:hypothetical protein BY458DRAFT_523040, partial [Sporodiniella umbellata]
MVYQHIKTKTHTQSFLFCLFIFTCIIMSPSTTMLHPLDTEEESYSRRGSFSSSAGDSEAWSQLLSQFNSQPDIRLLIEQCKEEEDRRREEETKMRWKEYQLYYYELQRQGHF